MSLIIPANTLASGGYEVANSVRLNDGSSDYFNRSPSSAGNTKKFTISFWLKRGTITGADQNIFHAFPGSGSRSQILFNSSEQLLVDLEAGNTNRLITTRLFRDTSAWYHIVIVYDSDNGTSGNRVIIYINGVRETSFGTETYPSSGSTSQINTTTQHEISSYDGSGSYFDGYLAEFVLLDGTVADATSFGEFDEDSGIFKPINVSGLTFGTNGFYLDFEDSAALGDDVSGNGNDFTVNNLTAIDQSTDTCTNNFATLNPLWTQDTSLIPTLAEGNLLFSGGGGGSIYQTIGTIAFTKGKWFWECKFSTSSGLENASPGIVGIDGISGGRFDQKTPAFFWRNKDGGEYILNNSTSTNDYGTFAQNNIISFAIDMDASTPTATIYKNGSAHVSNISLTSFANKTIAPAATTYESGSYQWNFGSPPYSESGGNSDGNGYGNFSMTVPSSYYSLNTKNLAEYG